MFMDWVIHIGQLCTVKQQHPHLAPHKVKFSFLTPQPLPCPTMAQVRVPAVAFYLQHPYSLNSKLESKPECPAFSVVISSYSAEYTKAASCICELQGSTQMQGPSLTSLFGRTEIVLESTRL
jgi:hypothetical protein